jgi:hypothetical protein
VLVTSPWLRRDRGVERCCAGDTPLAIPARPLVPGWGSPSPGPGPTAASHHQLYT